MSHLVLGTAGHVDHGKTSLVKALTGVDLDSRPEEKARGITIALGFTSLALPSGRTCGLVDVPGHETLVRTMVAGATGIDAAILCVSAVEGVMPQAREHLQVLGLVGTRRGVVALTMSDLVDAEMRELAIDDVRRAVEGTFLDGAPIIPTSAVTREGLPELLAAIDAIAAPPRALDAPFRLPVDRSFQRKGFGTVVTGTAWSGRLADGTEVEILPSGTRARVRGIQVHGGARAEAMAGARTALNLAGVDLADAGAGSWIVEPGRVPSPRVIGARYRHLPTAAPLEDGARVLVLHGTREVVGRLGLLRGETAGPPELAPGTSALVQLRLAEALPCLPGDPFVVRRESPAETLGGGRILDPWSVVARARDVESAAAILARVEAGDATAFLDRAGAAGVPEADARARGWLPAGVEVERIGDLVLSRGARAELAAELRQALEAFHAAHPLAPGCNRKELQRGVLKALDERRFLALLDQEAAAGRLAVEGGRARLPGFAVALSAGQEAWRRQVIAAADAAGFDGIAELPAHADREALEFLLRERGEVEHVGERWVAGTQLARLSELVRGHFSRHVSLDPAQFKELTGQTRRTAIPLLEWLDARGVTKRTGDVRVRGS